jgi:cAMP phosphodiesterase
MTSLLINDTIALDAGSLAQALSVERQERVRSIVLSHSHSDHTNSLPFFVENVFEAIVEPIDIYASAATIYSIRKHLFNNDVWPDFSRMPNNLLPAMRFHELQPEIPVKIGAVRLTPFPVDHAVPTFGFLIEEGSESLLWSSDTGPTHRLWELANQVVNLKALCVEVSFDNSMQRVADISYHLTPRTLQQELSKLERRVPLLIHHMKPPCIEPIRSEIRSLGNPDLHYLEQGKSYKL